MTNGRSDVTGTRFGGRKRGPNSVLERFTSEAKIEGSKVSKDVYSGC